MYKLMEKQDQKKYQLLKYLQSSVNSTFTMDELIEQLQLSEAKLSEIIEELRLDYRQHYSDEQEEKMLKRNNFNKVIKGANFSAEPFFNIFINRSLHYQMALNLFYDKEINFEKYSIERQVSHSTIMRAWRHLKNVLASYQIDVVKKNGQFHLKGKEEHIRYFFYILFRDSGEKMPTYLNKNHFNYFVDNYQGTVTQQQIESLNLFLAICLIRIQKKLYIEASTDYFSVINHLYDSKKFKAIFKPFYQKKNHLNYLEKELTFLYFFAATWTKYDLLTVSKLKTYIQPDNLNKPNFVLCNKIIFDTSMNNNLNLSPTEYFYLFANLLISIRKNEVFDDILNANEEISNMASFKIFERKLPSDIISQTSISVEQLYMIFYPLFKNTKQTIKILLLTRFGLENKTLLQQKLTLLIENNVQFVDLLSESPNLIVTDSFYERKGIPTFYMPPFPNNRELARLAEYIDNRIEINL